MAKLGPPREMMVDAVGKRLHQIIPEPPALYSFGKVNRATGLKPDIYLHHVDGREWAIEMVHGNRKGQHLLDNHARYAKAGIRDIWILWETLRRKTGSKASLDQGVMPSVLQTSKTYPLNSTHRAILEMQTGNERYLYAFNLRLPNIRENPSPLFETMVIGIDIYRFDGWQGETDYLADFNYVSLADLEFAMDGSPIVSAQDEDNIKKIAKQLGLDVEDQLVLTDLLTRLNTLLSSSNGLGKIAQVGLLDTLQSLGPEEALEAGVYLNSGGLVELQQIGNALADVDMNRALKDGAYLLEIAQRAVLSKDDWRPRVCQFP